MAENKDWVPWEFKKQRPDKVPGCQDTSCLPIVEEGELCCRENQQCYYFSCLKCSPLLALDTFNPRYKNTLQYVPRIADIEAPDPFKKDNKYYQYYGEVFELYFRFFSQITELAGIAVNGWNNLEARKIFNHVNTSFEGTKFSLKKNSVPKDFEIDWILFDGMSVTIIEVRGTMCDSKSNKHFETKVEQIKKDRIIMQHLLEVTNCADVKTNYIIACPTVSIKEVTEGKILRNHDHFFQTLAANGNGLGFISEESILNKSLYVYNGNDKYVSEQLFIQFINQAEESRGTTRDHWDVYYNLLTSSVVMSKALIGQGQSISHLKTSPVKAQNGQSCLVGTANKEVSISVAGNGQKTRKLPGIPDELRNFFPENLVLGPEQLVAIRCKNEKILLRGEPGCGKSFVLLALLFTHTAKCKQNMEDAKYKNVLFCIPREKTEFWNYVQNFIDKYCNEKYVKLIDFVDLRSESKENVDLILVDETPFDPDMFTSDQTQLLRKLKICWANATIIEQYKYLPEPKIMATWTIFYFGNAYRCPSNIALRYTQLKRRINLDHSLLKMDRSYPFRNSSLHVIDETAVKILKYRENITECDLPQKELTNESLLLVIIGGLRDFPHFGTNFDYCFTYRADWPSCNNYLKFSFTGVQYDTVVIIIGHEQFVIDIKSEYQLLYHAVSRALRRLVVFYPEEHFIEPERALSLDCFNSQALMKLKTGRELSRTDFKLMNEEDIKEALDIFIISKDFNQFKKLMTFVFKSRQLTISKRDTLRLLASKMLNFEEQQAFFTMLKGFFQLEFNSLLFPSFYTISADSLTNYNFVSNGRKILPQLKQIHPQMWTHFPETEMKHSKLSILFTASIIWSDIETFQMLVEKFKHVAETHAKIFDSSTRLPPHSVDQNNKCDRWKNFDECMNYCFEKYSRLENDRLCYSGDMIRSRVNDQIIQAAMLLHPVFGISFQREILRKHLFGNFKIDRGVMADSLN